MISNSDNNLSGVSDTSSFNIEMNASVFTMLSKNVYNDVILAPIREWSTNAVDACIAAGRDPSFDVHLPTLDNLVFSVRDYGDGLSKEDILGLFSTFGASTKRDSNAYNGTFGIGRMSGLAYASSFSIESIHQGQKHSYLISVQDGIPVSVHLGSTPCNEPSGLRLHLAVMPEDVKNFHAKAIQLYKYFDTQPTINTTIPELETTIDHDLFLLTSEYNNGIIMGNIYYPVDGYQIHSDYNGLVLKLPIGAVSITPGRESLTYDKETKKYLKEAYKKAEAIIIGRMNTEIAKKSTVIEQFKAYGDLFTQVPYNARQQLKKPKDPQGALSLQSSWGAPYTSFNHPDFEITVKSYNYRVNRTLANSHLTAADFTSATFLLVDQRNFNPVVSLLDASTVVIFKPKTMTKEGFEKTTPIIEAYLQHLGITEYTKTSEYEVAKKEKIILPDNIPLKGYNGNSFYKGPNYNTKTDTKEILYIPISGSSSEYPSYLLNAITKLRSYLKSKKVNVPEIYGVQKKYIKDAETLTTFTHFMEYFKDYFDIHNPEHVQFNLKPENSYYRFYASTRETCRKNSEVPNDLKEALDERKLAAQSSVIDYFNTTDLEILKVFFPITYSTSKFKQCFDSLLTKYPLLNLLEYCREDNVFSHYFKLEKAYHVSLRKDE